MVKSYIDAYIYGIFIRLYLIGCIEFVIQVSICLKFTTFVFLVLFIINSLFHHIRSYSCGFRSCSINVFCIGLPAILLPGERHWVSSMRRSNCTRVIRLCNPVISREHFMAERILNVDISVRTVVYKPIRVTTSKRSTWKFFLTRFAHWPGLRPWPYVRHSLRIATTKL